jgi:hypothetical protein
MIEDHKELKVPKKHSISTKLPAKNSPKVLSSLFVIDVGVRLCFPYRQLSENTILGILIPLGGRRIESIVEIEEFFIENSSKLFG